MEQRRLKILYNKPGGTSSKGGISARVSLPKTWLDTMGITQECRDVIASFDGEQIEIRRAEDEEQLGADAP